MLSMTGYSFVEEVYDDFQLSIEVKSLNNRFLDINLKLPYVLNSFDVKIRNIIKKYAKRGKIDVTLNFKELVHNFEIKPDLLLAKKYYKSFDGIKKYLEKEGLKDNVRLFNILNAEGVIVIDEKKNLDHIWEKTEILAHKAGKLFIESKEIEGENTKKDLVKIVSYLEDHIKEIEKYSDISVKKYEEKLKNKVIELLQDKKIEEERILQEVAIMATKIDINEELSRLLSHMNLIKNTLKEDSSIGRKLDFISQEINREINTIGSKSLHIDISNITINMKTELEKLKEQIRNIE